MDGTPIPINSSSVLRWYPLRIYHSSLKRQNLLKEALDQEASVAETYIPHSLIDAQTEKYTPTLVNYIFVRISLHDLKRLKSSAKFDQLRYVMKVWHDEKNNKVSQIAHISDREMDNFQQVVNKANEQVQYIHNVAFAMRPGQKVRIADGMFKGTEGTIKSIKKHLCVIVTLGDVMAVAITGIHRKFLQPLD